jgi:hypothetical protein
MISRSTPCGTPGVEVWVSQPRAPLQHWHQLVCWLRDQYNLKYREIRELLALDKSAQYLAYVYLRHSSEVGPPQIPSELAKAARTMLRTRDSRATVTDGRKPEEPPRRSQWRCAHHWAHNLRFDRFWFGLTRSHAGQFADHEAIEFAFSEEPIPTCERCAPNS